MLAQTVRPEASVVGLDPSREMIRYASRQAARISNCRFQVGSAEALDFPDEDFDVVVSSLVIHHLPEDLQAVALREMRRVLLPGRKLLIAEAQTPREGRGWRLVARIHAYNRMAHMVPDLEPLAAQAGFGEIRTGEAPSWFRYLVAVKAVTAS